ncbi:MAG: NfeD family protein [Halobacteriales archaeon]
MSISSSPPQVSLALILLLAGIVLTTAEAIVPGAHFIVLGVALISAGLLGVAFSPLNNPIALSVLLIIFGGIALYLFRTLDIYGGKGLFRTSDADSLRDKTGYVAEQVTSKGGKVNLYDGGFDSLYSARSTGETISTGTEIRVVDPGGGNMLVVEPVTAKKS